MLSKFHCRSKVLLIPAAWLNAVASILNTIASPKGTVSAKLKGDGDGSVLSIDIIPSAVARAIVNELSGQFPRKGDNSLLGEGLKWGERGLTIDTEWLAKAIVQALKA